MLESVSFGAHATDRWHGVEFRLSGLDAGLIRDRSGAVVMRGAGEALQKATFST